MLKAKKYDWKDSNMALFGSDTEKKGCHILACTTLLFQAQKKAIIIKITLKQSGATKDDEARNSLIYSCI